LLIKSRNMKKIILFVSFICYTLTTSSQIVTTLAGSGSYGFLDGLGTIAQFGSPYGVCTDNSGNVYVAESGNNRIRKISPLGVVTTLAGSGVSGYNDGTGTAAQFNNPLSVCADYTGNVYVADSDNNRIRKISPAGVVTTLAGSGISGYLDGTGTIAQFNRPSGVCADYSLNVYVADPYNNRIRKISGGIVTTLAGAGTAGYLDGLGSAAKFNSPTGVYTGPGVNNVFVADMGNQRIRKITFTGIVTTVAGSGISGYLDDTATLAQFKNPSAVCTDGNGNLYVADNGNQRIRKISGSIVTTLAGSGTAGYLDGTGTLAQFKVPTGVCTDVDGNVFVADNFNNRIRKITVTLSVDQNNMSYESLTVYPNPASDKFTIDFGNELISNYTIKINNLLGQEVYSNFIDKSQFEVNKTWQGEGMYFVKILNAQNEVLSVKKIMLY
jgi:sugar lactone lactonase YvrE